MKSFDACIVSFNAKAKKRQIILVTDILKNNTEDKR